MNKHILTVTCPACRTALQVKTRSTTKIIVCPKCQTMTTVSVAPNAAPSSDSLPEAALWQDEPQTQPFAETTAPPVAPALTTTNNRRSRAVAIAVGASAAVLLLGVGIVLAIRSGNGGLTEFPLMVNLDKSKNSQGSDKVKDEEVRDITHQHSGEADKGQGDNTEVQHPTVPIQTDNASSAKTKLDQAVKRIQSLQRQKRDWLLANSGRQFASGKKLLIWPNERLLEQAQQEHEMALREYERSK